MEEILLEQSKNLIRVANIDVELTKIEEEAVKIKKSNSEKKEESEKLEFSMGQLKAELETFLENHEEITGKIQGFEEEIKNKDERLKDLRSNVEYQANLREIENFKKAIKEQEGISLAIMERVEELKKLIAEKEEKLKGMASNLDDVQSTYNEQKTNLENRQSSLESEKKELINSLKPELTARYRRIKKRREFGPAISQITESGSCSNCSMLIPPQMVNLIMAGDENKVCASCNCILVYSPSEENT